MNIRTLGRNTQSSVVQSGKASSGGLRIGEMEQWCLTAHGVSRFMSEKFRDHSDGYDYYVCNGCRPAIVNIQRNIYKCKFCKDNAEIARIPTTWSSKLFMQEMDAMNVGVKMHLEPYEYENFNVKDFDEAVVSQMKIEQQQADHAANAQKLREVKFHGFTNNTKRSLIFCQKKIESGRR